MLGEARGIKPFVFIPEFMEGLSKAIDMKMPLDKEPVDTSQFVHPLTFLWKIRRNTPLQIPLQAGHVVQLTSVTLINLVVYSDAYLWVIFFFFFTCLRSLVLLQESEESFCPAARALGLQEPFNWSTRWSVSNVVLDFEEAIGKRLSRCFSRLQ